MGPYDINDIICLIFSFVREFLLVSYRIELLYV